MPCKKESIELDYITLKIVYTLMPINPNKFRFCANGHLTAFECSDCIRDIWSEKALNELRLIWQFNSIERHFFHSVPPIAEGIAWHSADTVIQLHSIASQRSNLNAIIFLWVQNDSNGNCRIPRRALAQKRN